MRPVVVRKLNLTGEETWRYTGEVLAQNPERIILEAYFNRKDLPFHGLVMRNQDRFVEVYFARRWYNIFEIHDKDDDHLKCWYCNVTFPAEISDVQISYVDLALDLLVFPGGKYMVLDEDEFAALPLDATSRAQAFSALNELKKMAALNQLSPVLF
jgi:predicted RNA-binding protein associated with RNAse of E/G family